MFIKEIRIRNFRSIVKAEIELNNMSVFVGYNDVGKSNILKSLNLFFNYETDNGKPLDFVQDYCKYTPPRKKKAEEIIIELIISAPRTYAASTDIKWIRVWRKSGFYKEGEYIGFTDGKKFPPKSKLYSWIQNIRYTYVPAIRGNSYFQILLAQLHDTLAETIEGELKTAGDDFIDKIKLNTEEMSNEIFERIGMKSQIRFPSNLQTLFKTLDFATLEGIHNISLSNRGDGIKTRHIPAILKFIADQLNVNKVKGSPNVSMIWGYEEPENNLEMLASFKLAEQFVDYSKDIQLLITTHSPGFYSLKAKHNTIINLFKVVKPVEKDAQIVGLDSNNLLDHDMGLIPIITPHIQDKIIEIEKLKKDNESFIKEIQDANKNVIFVEGDDEVRVFTKLISQSEISHNAIAKREGMGCSGVRNYLMSWSWISGTTKLKTVGIFDNDPSGIKEFDKLKNELKFIDAQQKKLVKSTFYKAPKHLQNIKSKINNFPIEIEEMYPPIVWNLAKKNNWVEPRSPKELNSFVWLESIDKTIAEQIKDYGFEENEEIYVFYKVPDKHKDKLSKYVIVNSNELTSEEMLKPLLDFFNNEILNFLK